MWINTLNPTILDLGPLEIRWYGLVYVLGFFLAVWWLHYTRKHDKIQLTPDDIWDLVFYLMVGVLIGARLFEIFWEPSYYLSNPLRLFKIWEGGMSFHGGFVGIVTACWWYCRKKNLNFWKMADVLCVPAMFALALGRVANFINGELVGRVWNGRWCVVFPKYDQMCRHPYVLYESAKRLVIFGWLLFLTFRKEFRPGFIFWNFVFWEGLGRFLLDFVREETMYLGLTVGQWFSAVMVLVALGMFWKCYREDWKNVFFPKDSVEKVAA